MQHHYYKLVLTEPFFLKGSKRPMTFSFHKFKIPLLFVFVIASFLLVTSFSSQTAYAALQPDLKLLSHVTEFDPNDCISATVAGKNFTRAGTAILTTSPGTATTIPYTVSTTPSKVSIGSDGNFEAKVTSCATGFPNSGTRLTAALAFRVQATDTRTGVVVTTRPVFIIDPSPRVHVVSQNVPLLKGCATIGIIGDHFIASGLVSNLVSILAYKAYDADPFLNDRLPHRPYQTYALGDGNIAVSTQVCGLKPEECFYLLVQDRGSLEFSYDDIIIQTY